MLTTEAPEKGSVRNKCYKSNACDIIKLSVAFPNCHEASQMLENTVSRIAVSKRARQAASVFAASLALCALFPPVAQAHRSGCHRWHSCPADTGSYVCGDLGYRSECPNAKVATKPKVKQTHARASDRNTVGGTHRLARSTRPSASATVAKVTPAVETVQSPFSLRESPVPPEVIAPTVSGEPEMATPQPTTQQ